VHWNTAKRVLQYLKGTRTWRLTYGEDSAGRGLEEYADADGLSLENCKAISGYAFLIDGGAVSWSSKQQDIVALSTIEAEYIALTYAGKETGKETMWTRHFISELFTPLTNPLTIYDDNQSALALAHAELGQFHARTKHIDIQYHFIRYAIQHGFYCPTDDMLADTLTKALPSTKARHFAHGIGLITD
jgi:hypothetical protein